MTGILGGTFDPPQNGHVALARAALKQLPIDRLVVLVVADPGHRATVADAETRLQLARAAFSGLGEVELDPHAFTVDSVRDGRFGDALFIVVGSRGLGAITGALIGSVSSAVLHRADRPVMVVPVQD